MAIRQQFAQVAAIAGIPQLQAKILSALRQAVGAFLQLLGVFQFGAVGNGDVFRQIQQLAAGERLTKVLTGDIRQLMGFIEDHHFRLGDQLGKAALFDHHIGQEQVMVDHHHVGVHRFFTRLHHEAIFIQWAVATETVIVGAGDQRPGLGVFRDAGASADIAILGLIRPGAQEDHIAEGLYRQIAARQRLLLKTFKAQVVGAPFEQRQFTGEFERLGDGGQIAAIELILQRFRASGDNHLFFRPQRRRQVSVGFTGSGPRFHHQRSGGLNRFAHRFRHLALRLARLKSRYGFG